MKAQKKTNSSQKNDANITIDQVDKSDEEIF